MRRSLAALALPIVLVAAHQAPAAAQDARLAAPQATPFPVAFATHDSIGLLCVERTRLCYPAHHGLAELMAAMDRQIAAHDSSWAAARRAYADLERLVGEARRSAAWCADSAQQLRERVRQLEQRVPP